MALHGKFEINDAYSSPLSFPGIGTFLAFLVMVLTVIVGHVE